MNNLKAKYNNYSNQKKSSTPSNTETTHRPKKRAYSLQIRGANRNQHRNNKGNDFYGTNNEKPIGKQQQKKNMLEYSSHPFGNILNLSKHSFSLNTYKLLNKNLNFVPAPKQCNQK